MSFPYKISLAITQVSCKKTCPFQEISKAARSLLQNILRLVNVREPSLPVWPSKDYLAEQTNSHPATVYRALNHLEQAGIITRKQQDRRRNGSFGIGKIALTLDAIAKLGLDCPSPSTTSAVVRKINEVNKEQPSRKLQGINNQSTSDQSLHNKHVNSPSFFRIGGFKLPSPLVGLVTWGGIDLKLVFWLMKLANQNKQRLEDILYCTQDRLKGLPSPLDRARYLTALCRNIEINFAKQRERLECATATANKSNKLKTMLIDVINKAQAGDQYCTENGHELIVEFAGEQPILVEMRNKKRAIHPINISFIIALLKGRVRKN